MQIEHGQLNVDWLIQKSAQIISLGGQSYVLYYNIIHNTVLLSIIIILTVFGTRNILMLHDFLCKICWNGKGVKEHVYNQQQNNFIQFNRHKWLHNFYAKESWNVCGETELIPPLKVTNCKGCPIYNVSFNSKLETF